MIRRLPQLQAHESRLEIPTILDRGLSGLHGADYVRLCAFAIDVDRSYMVDPESPGLAFGWEVFTTECFALHLIDPAREAHHVLLEDTCLSILEQSPDDQGYGSQLLFAVYHAVERDIYPASLRPLFRTWRKRPKQLLKALDALWEHPTERLAAHATYCLSPKVTAGLSPALTPATKAALELMASGSWPVPAR
jgi:hypothetical protein